MDQGSGQPPPPPPTPPPPPPPPPPGGVPGGDRLPPRALGDILGAAFSIYRANWSGLVLIVAIVVVPLTFLGFLLSHFALATKTTVVKIGTQSVTVTQPRSWGLAILVGLVTLAIAVIITTVLQAAILRAAAQATIGDPVDIEASYKWGLRRFGSVLLVAILVGLAVGLGFILLIIPGLILLVLFAVSIPAVVVEQLRGTAAMSRSWNLTKSHFWHVAGVIIVAALIAGVFSGVLTAFGGSNAVLRWILQTIAQIIVAPFSALVSVLLYLDLRARGESLTASGLRGELGE
jgi:hypothetical protein